jgi:hypothetical protein
LLEHDRSQILLLGREGVCAKRRISVQLRALEAPLLDGKLIVGWVDRHI